MDFYFGQKKQNKNVIKNSIQKIDATDTVRSVLGDNDKVLLVRGYKKDPQCRRYPSTVTPPETPIDLPLVLCCSILTSSFLPH